MSRRRIFWTAYAVGFVVASLIASFAIFQFHKLVPQSVDWQALRLSDLEGKPVSLADYEDKVLLVNVWATWCKPCIKEMPSLDALQQQHSDKLAVLTISDEDKDKLEKFREGRGYSIDFLKANAPLTSQSLTVYPTSYLLSKAGEIEAIYLGEQDWSSPKIQEKLQQLF
ncbi:thiol-disulfide isomerase/thioredoxin [Pontibacter ummariensis]|uniref:Thiol-disulfide isomerase or thioredoxin n=1 Tax=Pontibacter ummariensis TaxID=1610492 RepID=A0A239CEM3_9BACT|nr:TlpA disulfide reductase family protein [Pontibacter ummariensis]PRY15070.1 thiol-disulfide isomerase/thioredoxin [Pontibacter ummariensis]SNS18332.1 Thiol-disulfide isomerase or thioredoxin [Pontibacter ummariensis]